ncbi:melanoma inhibitory activity protein 2 isoform X2 [Python bivittatus]|uniref:Melanoma inhibitory activity protein 2 isoform X2 n=1 Tax=Python bivittatus TaxID=176946 RepID=A0A9F5J3J8_PYTBI|nr:melanoma inhibitory activity protein 2 isoform X2 [Python bivittatus]
MLKILDISLILLILSLLTNIKSTKVLSAQKKCGDPECETSMSRVLAIKDYTGPDCRYLSFRSGEEIMVYFKLSRKREDLWAGSKGTEFGYFPMDAVQTEEIFVTKEIEVPTKETDFLCLDGGEYVFENEDSIFNHHTEENEYVSLYPDGKDSDFNMPEDEIMKLPDTSIPTEYKGSFSDSNKGDHKAEDLHSLETLHHGDSELRHSKTDQDESSQQEDPITQALNPVPTQSTWTVSGTAGWLGLGSEENKKAVGQSSQISEQITFRRRKIAIADSADLKKQSEESEEEPHSWFQSTLTGLLHFGNEKSGLSLLYKDSDPGIHSSSNTASSTGHQGRTAASEARKDRHSDSELSKSNWFDLKLNDILTFGYTKKNKEQLANGEVDQNEDPLPPNMQSVSVDDGLKEAAVEQMLYDEQGKYLKTNIEQTTESVVDEEQQKEKYEAITSPDITDTEVLPGNEHSDFKNAEASSFSIQLAEKLKSSNTEQDSVSGNQIIENTQESERIKSQSGLYESIYNSIIDFNKVTSDNGLGRESPAVQSSIVDQLPSSHSIDNFVPTDIPVTGEENQKGSKKLQSFFSIRYFTNILNFQGFRAEENANTLEIDLKSNEDNIQPKSSDATLSIDKENKKQLLLNQNIIEKELENQYTDTSQENILLSSSAAKASEKIIEKSILDGELVKVNKQQLQLANSKLKSCLSYQCIQITNYAKHEDQTWKGLEIQGHFDPEDKNIVYVLEAKKQSLLEVENVADSPPEQQEFPHGDIYSYEESVVMKQKKDAGKIAGPDKIEQVENSLLQASETSVERISKKMSESIQENDKSSLETHEKLFFKELEEPLRDFSQGKDIPDDNEIPIAILDNGKLVIQGGRKETLLERRLVIEKGGIKETNREQEAKNTEVDSNEYSSNDAIDIKASYLHNQKEEEGIAEDARKVAHSPFSIHFSQDSVIHSKEKYSETEELQSLSSFSHYKDLFSVQSFPDKSKNSLQEIKRTKVENSQPKSSVESLQKNKEIEEKSMLHQKTAKEANLKEDIFNKDIFLFSSARQNNADNPNVTKDAELSETIFISSELYFSECIIDPLFQDQKACEKNIDKPHKTSELHLNLQRSTQQYKSMKRVSISRKQYINEIKHLDLKALDESTPIICYTDVMKKIEHSDQLASLQLHSEKHINNNIQENVIDFCKENEFLGVKNAASMSPGSMKIFPVSYNEDYQLNKSIITKEGMNQFSQERAKVQMHVSKQISESNDSQQDSKKIRTTEKYPDILKQQGLSPFTAGQELPQREEEFNGQVNHKLNFVTHSVQKKCFQDPQMQIGEKSNEVNSSGTIEEYSDNAQSCDFSSVAKTNDGHAPKEQTISHYPNSHTFSKKSMHLPHMSESLAYPKEDKQELKSEQKVLASHVDQSDNENSISSTRPDKKHISQEEYATKTYLAPNLEGEEFRNLVQNRKKDGILHTEDTEPEFQQEIVPLKLSAVASQKKTNNNLLLKKHGLADISASEDQESESVFQKAVQNGKLITDTGLDLKDASFSRRFQEFNLKLVEESEKILQANMCDSYELQQLHQEFEKLQYNTSISPREDIYKERKQVITLVEHEHKLNIGHEKCMKTIMHLLPEVQELMWDVRNNCGVQKAESGNGKLPGKALKEKHPLNSNKEPNNDQYSEKNMPPTNTKEKLNTSGKNGLNQQDVKEKVQGNNLMNQSCTTGNESKWLLQIILHLNEFCAVITSVFSSMVSMSKKVVSSLPENMRPGPDLYGFPWEIVICGTIVAIFTILLVLCRSYKSVRSRLYLGREKQLANKVAELVEDKCKVLEKLSLCKKEYAELENTLKDASFLQESIIASNIKTTYEELNNSNSALKNEIECLEKELKGEKSKQSEQDDLVAEIQKRVASLENEAKSIQLQVAEAKTTLKVYEINRERLKTSLQDAVEENGHLHESEKQLLQEAEGWDERFSELNEQTKMFESSQTNMEEALKNKESQVKSLTDGLLRMKDWSCATGEQDSTDDNHGNNDIKSETENGQHLDDPEKETVKKLIYAAKLNACLKSLETERNQLYSKLTDEKKAKEELAERTERLQREHVILQSGNTEFESEVQKLQQKLKVMTELYQENEMNLHRKLTVEEKERLQKEEKLSKVDEKINHAAEELNAYRQRAKDLEEELERTVRSYENQIMSHEKKAHDNWLTARAAERQLNDMRKENLHSRQKLTEAEFKYDILEKDPYAHDDTATAFGRGSRGLGNRGTPEVGNERGELNTNRLSDPHRPPSDTGSLSPPWDRDHRVILPHPGHLYNEQSLPPRRPERFYSNPLNSGRLSGPAELRSYNMHSLEKTDGLSSENNLRMDLSGNEIRDHSNGSNMLNIPDQSLPPENETLGSGIVPPPLPFLRAPLMSVDPRGSFMRRGPPFPPLPPGSVYGAQEYFPRDFAGLPRPLLPMRGPFPMRPFSQYPPPPRAGFFPPPPSDNRNELPAELTQLSTVSSTDHQESQQETG